MSKGLELLERHKKSMEDLLDNGTILPELYFVFKDELNIIEQELKSYEELTSKPVILYGRTHGHTKALIDTICKNYKEVKITNLEDEKKLKAFEILKKAFNSSSIYTYKLKDSLECGWIAQEEYDLVKEVLKSETIL